MEADGSATGSVLLAPTAAAMAVGVAAPIAVAAAAENAAVAAIKWDTDFLEQPFRVEVS